MTKSVLHGNVSITITNQPFGNGLYMFIPPKKMVIRGWYLPSKKTPSFFQHPVKFKTSAQEGRRQTLQDQLES